MGQIAPHGRFVHVYFNGRYRGQDHLRERWDSAMLSSYLPGKEAEYDTINANNSGSEFLTGESQDGDLTEWNQVRTLLNSGGTYAKVKDLLDVGNLIDFMLLWTAPKLVERLQDEFIIATSFFATGENSLAVEIHNQSSAFFNVDTVPASAENLVISEISSIGRMKRQPKLSRRSIESTLWRKTKRNASSV